MSEQQPLLSNIDISQEENTCRICFEIVNDDEYINVCSCDGYISYVHQFCPNKWVNISRKTKCEFCNDEYKTGRKLDWSRFFSKLEISNVIITFIIFSFLILTLFPNNLIYANNIPALLCSFIFIFFTIKRSNEYLREKYNESYIINVLEIDYS